MQLTLARIIALLISFARIASAATKVATYCNNWKTLCVSFAAADATYVSVFIQTKSTGWAGLGFGSSMTSARSFIISGKSGYLSTRGSTSRRAEPAVASVQEAKALSAVEIAMLFSKVPLIQFGAIRSYYKVPASWFNTKGATSLLYASAASAPTAKGSISYHDGGHAAFTFDIYANAK